MADIASTVSAQPDTDPVRYVFKCPATSGCGVDPFDPLDTFTSSDWPTAEMAAARGLQHIEEHITGIPAADIEAFKVAQGYTAPIDASNAPVDPVDLSSYLPTAPVTDPSDLASYLPDPAPEG